MDKIPTLSNGRNLSALSILVGGLLLPRRAESRADEGPHTHSGHPWPLADMVTYRTEAAGQPPQERYCVPRQP